MLVLVFGVCYTWYPQHQGKVNEAIAQRRKQYSSTNDRHITKTRRLQFVSGNSLIYRALQDSLQNVQRNKCLSTRAMCSIS